MRPFRDLSIKAKLNLSALTAGGAALLLASAALIYNNYHLICESKIQELSALANMLGANSTAALTFDDAGAAKELLASLSLQPTIHYACIYNAKGRVFASYHAKGAVDFTPPPPPPTGHVFAAGRYIEVSQEILRDKERIGTVFLHSSMTDIDDQLLRNVATVAIVVLVAIVVVFCFSSRLQRTVSEPILELARITQTISQNRDYSTRVEKFAHDELGTLYDGFNAMLDEIQRNERKLQQAHNELETRVVDRTRELSQANLQLSNEIGERKRTEAELETVHQQLVDAARKAGMAEVATGVLHNVGNVLNSINVSATLVADGLRNSKLFELTRALDLMNEHQADLGAYLAHDDRGKRVPGFLRLAATHMSRDHGVILDELNSLTKNVDHVKTIVAMQQSYAGAAGVVESVSLAELTDDALRLNASSLSKYHIEFVRDYARISEVRMEKQKVLQILMNLMTNAKDSLLESVSDERRLTVRIHVDEQPAQPKVLIEVSDNGVGIPKENLTRVFSHGFTTKRHGHGFGLHSSANAAKELGGTLTAHSDGPGHGALFILELPFRPIEVLT
jgi:C4-dicarboxylate-specific signal transduction histidine kinase